MALTGTATLLHAASIATVAGLAAIGVAMAEGAPVESRSSNRFAEINITSDSAKGWLPSASLEQEAMKAASNYFSLLDNEQYERAYGMMAEINRRTTSFPQYIRQNQEFHEKSGPLKRRDVLKITWTKDPTAAPFPGTYAAIDVATRFEDVDRHCGYIVLYQKPTGGSFEVMRQESNFIDNVTAQKIERQQSRASLDTMWGKLSANCPNYKSTDSPTPKP
jgi:Protein of unknown function (DUF4019)